MNWTKEANQTLASIFSKKKFIGKSASIFFLSAFQNHIHVCLFFVCIHNSGCDNLCKTLIFNKYMSYAIGWCAVYFFFVCHLNFVWHNFGIHSTTPTKMYQLPSQMIVYISFCLRLITHTNPELHFAITPHSHYLSDNEICAFSLRACVTNIKIYYRSPWLYNNLKNVGPFVGNDFSNE